MTSKFDFIAQLNKEVYNTIYGIESTLSSYEQLRAMLRDRHIAGYERREKLDEFVLFGLIYLDSCGNVWRLEDKVRAPKVLTAEDFNEIKEDVTRILWRLPPVSVNCFYCNKSWSVETLDFLDYSSFEDHQDITNKFIGKSLEETNKILKTKTDGWYYLSYNENEGSVVIKKDEKIFCHIKRFLHEQCMEQYIKQETEQISQTNDKNYDSFKNLAGDKFCDYYIEMELKLAGIPIKTIEKQSSEVPYSKIGFFE